MGTKTNLDILDLASIFQSLHQSKKTGTLSVTLGRQGVTHIYFENGNIQMLATPTQDISYRSLHKSNFILEEILQSSKEKCEKTGQGIAQILLDDGLIQIEDMERIVSWGYMEELCQMFQCEETSTSFTEGYADETLFQEDALMLNISLNPNTVVMEAARQMDELRTYLDCFDSVHDVPKMDEAVKKGYRARQDPDLDEIIRLINGRNDISDIATFARLSRLKAWAMLAQLAKDAKWRYRNAAGLARLVVFYPKNREKRIRLLKRAEERGGGDDELLMLLAVNYEAQGLHQEALKRLLQYAASAKSSGHLEGAAEAYRRILKIVPDEEGHYTTLIDILLNLGKLREAAGIYRELADKACAAKNNGKAIRYLNRLLELSDRDRDVREKLIRLYLEEHDPAMAIMELEILADHAHKEGALDQAIKTYRRALEIDPACIEAHVHLAEVLQEAGRTDEAVQEYQGLAGMLEGTGVIKDSMDWDFLIDVHERILALTPDNTLARQWLARCYADRGQPEKAVAHYLKMADTFKKEDNMDAYIETRYALMNLKPEDSENLLALGRALKKQGLPGAAKMELLKAGNVLLQQARPKEAKEVFEEVYHMDAFDEAAHTGLARIAEGIGHRAEAAEHYMHAGLLCSAAGYVERAVDVLAQSLALAENVWLQEHYVRCLEKAGDTERAVAECEKLMAYYRKEADRGAAERIAQKLKKLAPAGANTRESSRIDDALKKLKSMR